MPRQFGNDTLVEEFIEGKELTVGVIGSEALPVIHIEPVSGFYDINNKYPWMGGTGKTHYHCPADLPEHTALRACRTLALAGHARAGRGGLRTRRHHAARRMASPSCWRSTPSPA